MLEEYEKNTGRVYYLKEEYFEDGDMKWLNNAKLIIIRVQEYTELRSAKTTKSTKSYAYKLKKIGSTKTISSSLIKKENWVFDMNMFESLQTRRKKKLRKILVDINI